MKGVIAQINCSLTVVDLTHHPPKTWRGFANECLPLFSIWDGSCAVVDPGVGSTRRAVAVEFAAGFLVGPDNGLFWVLSQSPAITAVELTNPDY